MEDNHMTFTTLKSWRQRIKEAAIQRFVCEESSDSAMGFVDLFVDVIKNGLHLDLPQDIVYSTCLKDKIIQKCSYFQLNSTKPSQKEILKMFSEYDPHMPMALAEILTLKGVATTPLKQKEWAALATQLHLESFTYQRLNKEVIEEYMKKIEACSESLKHLNSKDTDPSKYIFDTFSHIAAREYVDQEKLNKLQSLYDLLQLSINKIDTTRLYLDSCQNMLKIRNKKSHLYSLFCFVVKINDLYYTVVKPSKDDIDSSDSNEENDNSERWLFKAKKYPLDELATALHSLKAEMFLAFYKVEKYQSFINKENKNVQNESENESKMEVDDPQTEPSKCCVCNSQNTENETVLESCKKCSKHFHKTCVEEINEKKPSDIKCESCGLQNTNV